MVLLPCLAAAFAVSLTARQGNAASVLSLTLKEAIEMSLEKNEDVIIARQSLTEREAQVREVRSGVLPSLTGDFNYARNIQLPVIFFETPDGIQQITIGESNAYNFGLKLQQTIDVFGRVPKALGAAHLFADIGDQSLDQVEREVAFNVKQLYYGVVLAEEMKDVSEQSLEQAEANLEQVESMTREGTRSRFDLLRARVEVANRKPELIRARNNAELSRSRLKRIIGIPLDQDIRLLDNLEMEPFDMDVDRGISLALERRPELKSIRMNEEMGEIQLSLAKLEHYPALFFSSNYLVQGQTERAFPENKEFAKSWSAGIGLTMPIFDGMKTRSHVDQARAQLSISRYREKKATEEIRLEVIEAFKDIDAAREEIASQEANVKEAEEAYRLAKIRFENGLATQLEVNDVELALNLARTNYIQALYNYNIAKAKVEKAIGEDIQ
jgi:outer membrane protein TolC